MNTFSHQQVFQFQEEELVTIGFAQGNELFEFEGEDQTGCSDGDAHVIISAVGIHYMFFHIFAHEEADGLKKLTNILLDLFFVNGENEFTPFAVEGEASVRCEQLIHMAVNGSKYRDNWCLFRRNLNKNR